MGWFYALEVLNQILGGSNSARLYKTLVIDKALAISAGSWFNGRTVARQNLGFTPNPKAKLIFKPLNKF